MLCHYPLHEPLQTQGHRSELRVLAPGETGGGAEGETSPMPRPAVGKSEQQE